MAKTQIHFLCNSCGGVQPKWMGKCPDCGTYGSLEEFREDKSASKRPQGSVVPEHGAAAKAVPINQVSENATPGRIPTGIGELDRVLGGAGEDGKGGGLVAGSAVLVGGDPGIGKSTLLLQAAAKLAASGQRVLYVSAEESAQQIKMRAERLIPGRKLSDDLFVLADTNLARILEQARQLGKDGRDPALMVIDSVQMIYRGDLPAAPGSMAQLRACCMDLVYFAKSSGVALALVGHVTKDGALAGPKLLEHMVDTVLYFEGDRYHAHRVIRAIKNRFGTTLEVGLFEMGDMGLREVKDGAGLLAAEYQARSGSVVCPVLQGSRCLMVEIQALTASGFLGAAKRKVAGLDSSRLAMLIAVLEKRGGMHLADQDIFASAVGGMKVAEPAADLPLALAIAGAFLNRSLPRGVCAVGEVGLGGEVRLVQQVSRRIAEASRLGFKTVLAPKGSAADAPKGVKVIEVPTVEAAMGELM